MSIIETEDAVNNVHVSPVDVVRQLEACNIAHIFTVPDYVTLSVHNQLISGKWPKIRTFECCSEDEAITAAAGVWVGGAQPAGVMMQNQGLHACMNTIRACGLDAYFPFMLLVGQFGREEENLGRDPRLSRRVVVRVTEKLLEAYDIPYFRLESNRDLPVIGDAYRAACMRSGPSAVLFGATTAWDVEDDFKGDA